MGSRSMDILDASSKCKAVDACGAETLEGCRAVSALPLHMGLHPRAEKAYALAGLVTPCMAPACPRADTVPE